MPHTIFYFDDDAAQLEVFREMLGESYDVHVATTVAEARRVLAECDFDIIISDHKMPEIDGTEFLLEAAAVCPSSFRMLLTGAITVGEVLPQVGAGVVHLFMPKPWSEHEMREALERAVASLDVERGGRQGRKSRAGGGGRKKPAWLILLGF
ncbi:MAG: response regulator [Acidobacteria bacterium]|nr:response regulator [Acidobacteriota bacterium]